MNKASGYQIVDMTKLDRYFNAIIGRNVTEVLNDETLPNWLRELVAIINDCNNGKAVTKPLWVMYWQGTASARNGDASSIKDFIVPAPLKFGVANLPNSQSVEEDFLVMYAESIYHGETDSVCGLAISKSGEMRDFVI